ncbi:MAG: conjugal transfer protein TraI [Alphaproteobacteria bacterium 65-37]|jgi:acyl homoserine lactone synthase|uniref:acyl-homoserine-lactone synthase n=1 Tax=uncultured Reyranella sp. TaxID=735512 RepID=UPI000962C6A1|nr:acyl-homoserine-lactone synthase [uncultured Reyranella sp.]OJU35008.1 MAG: conjugal transfer protein TraI [Alphaproteobacteria bacterium 65-37]
MIQLITSDSYGSHLDELADMHRLRYRIFKQRLDWDVQAAGDMEVDEFDALHPCYLLLRSADGTVSGCVRLLPTTGPTMLRDTFAALLDGATAPASPVVWESSRFGLDPDHAGPLGGQGIAKATYELFAGMVEFGLSRGLTDIVTVTDVLMERILRRASWPLRRLGQPKAFGRSRAVAGYLEVSADSLSRIRAAGQLKGPALWSPVVALAA